MDKFTQKRTGILWWANAWTNVWTNVCGQVCSVVDKRNVFVCEFVDVDV